MQLLHNQRLLGGLPALATSDARYDIDAFSAIFRGTAALAALKQTCGGERHAIHPRGADNAEHRGLYVHARFAMVGLAQPERRRGDGLLLERNRCAPPRLAASPLPLTCSSPCSSAPLLECWLLGCS